MSKEVQMAFRIEPNLRDEFAEATAQAYRPAAQVLREFMRAYVTQAREREQSPANNAVSPEERHRREEAASFALASVSLEGFKPSVAALARIRQHINGEIELSELVQVTPGAEAAHSR